MKQRLAAAVLAGVATVGLASPAQAANVSDGNWETYVKMVSADGATAAKQVYNGTVYDKAVRIADWWNRKGYETCVVPDYKYFDCVIQFGI